MDLGLTWKPGQKPLNFKFVIWPLVIVGLVGLFLPMRILFLLVLSVAVYVEKKRREYWQAVQEAGSHTEHLRRCLVTLEVYEAKIAAAEELREELRKELRKVN